MLSALPHATRSAVSPTPLYCAPKNRAVINRSPPIYTTPDRIHTNIFLRFTFFCVTVALVQDDKIRIIDTAYPICSHFKVSVLISHAVSAVPVSVINIAADLPLAIPVGTELALPVCFCDAMSLSPFSTIVLLFTKKRTGTVSVPVFASNIYTSTSGVLRGSSWASRRRCS